LIAKAKLFTNAVPNNAGGGSVVSVTRTYTEYTRNVEAREEAGTPDITGGIKVGLVFELKRAVGHDKIHAREMQLAQKFIDRFQDHRTLFILGPTDVARLPIFAFLIFAPALGKYLHHNFICSLLNDLFGIQVRSGCSCAGPYVLVSDESILEERSIALSLSQDLLDIDEEQALIYTKFITENPE
jgi:selenocysteine lyase/cysteine desulfurase